MMQQRLLRLKSIAGCALLITVALWAISASKITRANAEEGSTHSVKSVPAEKSSANCGDPRQTLVVLDAENGIQLLIPQPFLLNSSKTLFRPVEQSEAAQIAIRKDTFQPACEDAASADAVLSVQFFIIKPDQLAEMLKAILDRVASGTARTDDPHFERYSPQIDPRSGHAELLIPKGAMNGKVWVICNDGSKARGALNICRVTQKISGNIVALYLLKPTDLARYEEIFTNVERLAKEFMANGKDRKASELIQTYCDNPKKIRFQFSDEHHTVLFVPESYLNDRYGVNREKEDAKSISLRMHKDSYQPKCDKQIGTLETDIKFDIKAGRYSDLKNAHRNTLRTVHVGQENEFELYRDKSVVKSGDLRGSTDLLIRREENPGHGIFIECSRPGFRRTGDARSGCTVYAELTDTMLVRYSFHHTDLPKYKEITAKVREVALSFFDGHSENSLGKEAAP